MAERDRERRPALVDPDAIRPTLGLAEVEGVAGYGPPPEHLLAAAVYALAVWNRRGALREARGGAARRLRKAASEAERAIGAFGRSIVEAGDPALAGALGDAYREAARALAEAEAADHRGAAALASVQQEQARADDEVAAAEAEVGPFRDQETKLAAQLEVAEHDLRRTQARLARAEIELRNLNATGGGPAERAAMLEADVEARRAEATVLEGRVAERSRELGRVRRELALRVGRVAAAEEARRTAGKQAKKASSVHEAAQTAVERGRDAALFALGREALWRGVGGGLEGAEAAAGAEREWAARAREVALHDAALDGWDRGGFLKGASVLGAGLAIGLVTALVAAFG
jgi:hypothetical protein